MDGSRLQDTPLVVMLRLMADLMGVNLLAIFCAIPLVTAGASLSAMYAVLLHRERNDGNVSVISTFIHAFIQNLLPSIGLELIVLAVAIVAGGDIWFALNAIQPMRSLYLAVGAAIAVIGLILFLLLFPQQAIYNNSIRNYVKNSFFLAFCAPGRLVLSAAAWILPWALMAWQPGIFLVRFGAVYLMWGVAFPAWATAKLLNGIFLKTEENRSTGDGEEM